METDILKPKEESLEYIYSRTEENEETSCWTYKGGTNGKGGYGRMYFNKKMRSVHKVVYELTSGKVPTGMVVHHVCGHKLCCNPDHLQAISHRLNIALSEKYTKVRNQRLRFLIASRPDIEYVEVILKSTTLKGWWDCESGNVPDILDTMKLVEPKRFSWRRVKKGHGPKPGVYAIRMDDQMIEEITSGKDSWQSFEDIFSPVSSRF